MPSQLVQYLWDRGYFFSPEALNISKVSESDLDSLNSMDIVVQAATLSLQTVDENYAIAVAHAFGDQRMAVPDGEAGPATQLLINMPNCGCRTFADPDDPEEAATYAALDRGSWDTDCVPGYEGKHAVIVHWDGLELLKEPVKSNFEQLWELTVAAQSKVGLIPVWDKLKRHRAHILASVSRNMPGGAIGYAQVINNPSCGTQAWGRVHPDYLPSNWRDTWPALIIHELFGHISGMGHTSGGIMNSSIRNVAFNGWEDSDPGKPTQVRWFGGPVEPPAPDPGPDPGPPGTVPAPGQPLTTPFEFPWMPGVKAQTYRVFGG